MQCATFNIQLIGSRFQSILIIPIFGPKNQARDNRSPRGNYNHKQAIQKKTIQYNKQRAGVNHVNIRREYLIILDLIILDYIGSVNL